MDENTIYSYFDFGGGGFSLYQKQENKKPFQFCCGLNEKTLLLIILVLQLIILWKK